MFLRLDCAAFRQHGNVRQYKRQCSGSAHGGSVRQCTWWCMVIRVVVCGCLGAWQRAAVCGSELCAAVCAAVCGIM
jgi:hypothetical protein